ncbi:hypothetical protein UFOVP658_85 [uncultured Caudovirales phage]|uniref:Uncharacterized protein n=1 Tax=uncultured Caudovirales phage TaxID=2100421 RepID=A0A6J5NDA0_9CAUD|nr:hypothetical protein UFOVP658_85 [uncultured Caudovirales phage]
MSEYNKLKSKGLSKGRPPLSEQERAERKAIYGKKQEARRRAHIVLQHRYAEDYQRIYSMELKELLK